MSQINLVFTPNKSIGVNSVTWSTSLSNTSSCQIQLPNTLVLNEKDEVCLNSISFTNSVYNLTPENNNDILSYVWTNGVIYDVTFIPGFYTIDDMSRYIQEVMLSRGHVLLDNQNQPVYFFSMILNKTYLTSTLTLTPIPNSLPAGWINPSNSPLGKTIQIIIPQTKIREITGFESSTYPLIPSNTVYQINSQKMPKINPVQVVNVNTNLINELSLTSSYSNTLLTFNLQSFEFGEIVNLELNNPIHFKCISGAFNTVTLSLTDQSNKPINLKSNDITAILHITRRN